MTDQTTAPAFTFVAAPPPEIGRRKSSPTDAFRAAAIANSGQWAPLETFDTLEQARPKASLIRNSKGAWEGHTWGARISAHATDPGKFVVWVSHVSTGAQAVEQTAVRKAEAVAAAAQLDRQAAQAQAITAAVAPSSTHADPVDMGDADPEQDAPAPEPEPEPTRPALAVVPPPVFVPPAPPAAAGYDPLADPYGLPVQP